jgi:[acyl-carrier-protein] S-malonyltransferase
MGNTAIVFSGQGAQYSGMGKYLYDNYDSAKEVFSRAEKLRKGTISQCFEGSKEELDKTENTQPCLFAVDLAAAYALEEAGVTAKGAAGFSLGEVAGVVFCGMLDFEEGFRLVCKRAALMAEAARESGGVMAAVLKISAEAVEKLCTESEGFYPVNYNCEGQTVVAGVSDKLALFSEKVSAAGGKVIKLAVSGAFHSPYMQKAYEKFNKFASQIEFSKPRIPLYANVTALPYGNPAELLPLQIKSPVLWRKTIENMISEGFDTFIEAGAGNTLSGLIKRINGAVKIYGTNNKEEFKAALSACKW